MIEMRYWSPHVPLGINASTALQYRLGAHVQVGKEVIPMWGEWLTVPYVQEEAPKRKKKRARR